MLEAGVAVGIVEVGMLVVCDCVVVDVFETAVAVGIVEVGMLVVCD